MTDAAGPGRSMTWIGPPPPVPPPPGAVGWLRIALRLPGLIVVLATGLALTLLLRPLEAGLHGVARPWTGWITVAVCRLCLPLLGLRASRRGGLAPGPSVIAANHSSWADIFALNACGPMVFVSKAEVAGWPGIGWLARATGTVFVARDPRKAEAQLHVLRARLAAGQRLVLFPEGTSTDGRRVLPFRPTLFAAVLQPGACVQPASLLWQAPPGRDPAFYGWWGGMDFGPHLLALLAAPMGRVSVTLHPALTVPSGTHRKAIAAAAEAAVRSALPWDQPPIA